MSPTVVADEAARNALRGVIDRRGGVSIDRPSPGYRVRAGLRRVADAHDELGWL